MPRLSTHFLTKALLTGMNLTALTQKLQDGPVREIPALFEQVYFASITVASHPDTTHRCLALPPAIEKGLLDTLARLKHIDPLVALVTVLNIKDRLATYADREQRCTDTEFLVKPLLEGMAELSSCEDLPPALRARAFISLLQDQHFDEQQEGHLSALRAALSLFATETKTEITLSMQAQLAACCINSARMYIGRYGSETTEELAQSYEPLARSAARMWKVAVQDMPTPEALAHLCEVEFLHVGEDIERLAAEITSYHYEAGHAHTTPESFRDTVMRLAPQVKIF
jgi:hypothetical protein